MKKIVLLSVIMNSISPQVWAMDENEKGSKSPLLPRKAGVSEVPDNPEQRPPSNPQDSEISWEEAVQNFALENRCGLSYHEIKEKIFLSLRTIESPKERLATLVCLEAICPKIRNLKFQDMSKILSKLKAIQSPDQRLATMTFLQKTAPNLSHVAVESLGQLIYWLQKTQSLDEYSASISCLEAIGSKVRHLSTNDLRDILLDVKRIEALEHRLDIMTFLQDISQNAPYNTPADFLRQTIEDLKDIPETDQRQSTLAAAVKIFQKKPDLLKNTFEEPNEWGSSVRRSTPTDYRFVRPSKEPNPLRDIMINLAQMKDSTHRHLTTAFVQEIISKIPNISGSEIHSIVAALMTGSKQDKINQTIDFLGEFWPILTNFSGFHVAPLMEELRVMPNEAHKQIALDFFKELRTIVPDFKGDYIPHILSRLQADGLLSQMPPFINYFKGIGAGKKIDEGFISEWITVLSHLDPEIRQNHLNQGKNFWFWMPHFYATLWDDAIPDINRPNFTHWVNSVMYSNHTQRFITLCQTITQRQEPQPFDGAYRLLENLSRLRAEDADRWVSSRSKYKTHHC